MIIMIGPNFKVRGGISSVYCSLYENSDFFKREVKYISTYNDQDFLHKMTSALTGMFAFLYCVLFKEVRLVHVNIAEGASFFREGLIAALAMIFRKRTVVHMHSGLFVHFYSKSTRIIRKLIKRLFYSADRIIFLSDTEHRSFKVIIGDSTNVRIVNNGISNIVQYSGSISKIDTRKQICLLYMGRVCKNKGIFTLIDTAHELRTLYTIPFQMIVCGHYDIKEMGDILQRIESLGLSSYFSFTGWIGPREKIDYLNQCDIYIHPSLFEGMPISIIEALMFGKPVIATNVGGVPEMIQNDVNGYLVDIGDYQSIAKHVVDIAGDSELYCKMSKFSRECYTSRYDLQIMERKLIEVYSEII